jgi:Mrp family chromosome partitioning ATPase
MSKIYDALEHAQQEKLLGEKARELPPPPAPLMSRSSTDEDLGLEDEMISLYQVIVSSLPHMEHRSVMFVGSRTNEGTSTIARHLARVASERLEKSVLLIDIDRSRPDLHVYTNLKPAFGGDGASVPDDPIGNALCQVEESSLYVMPLFQKTMVRPRTLDSAKGCSFWDPLKERFDLIIVDSPPATKFPDGPAIVSQVDGVILVVEAERTRWQVALSVKEKIINSGGNLLGTVFNKRRFYIPEFIYQYL